MDGKLSVAADQLGSLCRYRNSSSKNPTISKLGGTNWNKSKDKAKKALKLLSAGEKLKIIATDPGAIKDFHHFCEVTGDLLEKVSNNDGTITFIISKCSQN